MIINWRLSQNEGKTDQANPGSPKSPGTCLGQKQNDQSLDNARYQQSFFYPVVKSQRVKSLTSPGQNRKVIPAEKISKESLAK